ncbi:MAG TPA: hypothetical protein DIT04_10380 [Dysgonomonas sp.]|nr:hypothetical protein [Dysgonomonas sp.]
MIRNSFLSIMLSLIFVLSGCRTSRIDNKSKLDGIWTGYGYQFDIAESWEMILSCNTKKNEFTIDYPYLGCSGKWKLGKEKGTVFEFEEILEYGHDVCLDSVKVVIELLDNNTLNANFFWGGDIRPHAVGGLTRK